MFCTKFLSFLYRVSLTIYFTGCLQTLYRASSTIHCMGYIQQKGVIFIGCLQQNIYRVSYCTVCPQQYIVQGVLNNEQYRVSSTIHCTGCHQQYLVQGVVNTWYREQSTLHSTRCRLQYILQDVLKITLYRVFSTKYCTENSNSRINIPVTNLSLAMKSFSYRGAREWNNLPTSLRNILKISQFKKELRKWVHGRIPRFLE